MRAAAAARTAAPGTFSTLPIGPARPNTTRATTTLTTAAISMARRTMARERPALFWPTSIATRRTAAMSIPKRVAAPTTNASWVMSVICPNADGTFLKARAMRMFIAKLATTNTPRPTMF